MLVAYRLQRWLHWSEAWPRRWRLFAWLPLSPAWTLTLGTGTALFTTLSKGSFVAAFLAAALPIVGRTKHRIRALSVLLATVNPDWRSSPRSLPAMGLRGPHECHLGKPGNRRLPVRVGEPIPGHCRPLLSMTAGRRETYLMLRIPDAVAVTGNIKAKPSRYRFRQVV